MQFIKAALTNLFTHVTGLSASVWNFLEPILVGETGKLLQDLLPIAESVVLEIETTGGFPNQKRDAAFAQVQVIARTRGIDAANSVLNLAIEAAVAKLKTQHPVAATAPAPVNPTPVAPAI